MTRRTKDKTLIISAGWRSIRSLTCFSATSHDVNSHQINSLFTRMVRTQEGRRTVAMMLNYRLFAVESSHLTAAQLKQFRTWIWRLLYSVTRLTVHYVRKKLNHFLFFAISLVVWFLLSDFNVFTVAVRNALCKKYCFVKLKYSSQVLILCLSPSAATPLRQRGKVGRSASAEVMIQLFNSKCLPILYYGIDGLSTY